MSVEVKLDHGLRCAWLTVLAGRESTTVAETVLRLSAQRPVLGSWDWVIDTRNPHTQATPEEIDKIAAAFNAVTSKQSYTVFISTDPGTYERCALLGRKFRYRQHLVARSMSEAVGLLPYSMRSI